MHNSSHSLSCAKKPTICRTGSRCHVNAGYISDINAGYISDIAGYISDINLAYMESHSSPYAYMILF